MTTRWIAVLVAALGFAPSSSAAPIAWDFEGVVRYADLGQTSALATSLGVVVGAPVTGRVTYEVTTPIDPLGRGYAGWVVGFDVEIGSYAVQFALSTVAQFAVHARSPGRPFDLLFALGAGLPDMLLPTGQDLSFSLTAAAPGVIPTLMPSSTPPAVSALNPYVPVLIQQDWGTGVYLLGGRGEIVDIELTRLSAVPEPVTFAFLAPLALAFAALRRR